MTQPSRQRRLPPLLSLFLYLLALALLFSLLLFACGRLVSRWASLQQRVQCLEQLTAEVAERAEKGGEQR